MAGLWARLTGRAEQRYAPPGGWGGLALDRFGSAGTVSAREAEGLSAALGCIELISGAISSLPASLSVDTPDGRQPAPPTAAAWRVLQRPSPWQSWPAWASWCTAQILLHGNSVSRIETDGRGAVTGLTAIPWPWLNPHALAGADGRPRLAYDVVQSSPEARLLDLPPRLLDGDVLHIRARSDAGIIGRSVLARAAGPIREGLALAETASATFANGARPSGVLTSPSYLNEAQRKRFDSEFVSKLTGAMNSGRVPLLEGGWTYTPVAMSFLDAQFQELRGLNTEQVCNMFSVPSILLHSGQRVVSDLSPFTTAFAQHCLAPLCVAIEAEFDAAVLPPGMHLNLDLDGLMRGSFSATVAALCALLQSGAVTANDTRLELGFPPIDGGDTLRTGAAPSWPADASGMPSMGPKPGPTGDAPPAPGTHGNDGAKGNGSMPTGMMQ